MTAAALAAWEHERRRGCQSIPRLTEFNAAIPPAKLDRRIVLDD